MPLHLADPVSAYFDANIRFDVDAMLAPFAEDALIVDEKRTHSGHTAIRAWIEEATIGNRALSSPQSVQSEGDRQTVTAEVSGAFPGSPVMLTFRFDLAGSRIARLEID